MKRRWSARGRTPRTLRLGPRSARKSELIVDAIAEQEKVEVSDDEVADRVAAIVTQSGRQRDRAAEFYSHEENRAALKVSLMREKTLDLLLSRAQIEDAPASEAPAGETPVEG